MGSVWMLAGTTHFVYAEWEHEIELSRGFKGGVKFDGTTRQLQIVVGFGSFGAHVIGNGHHLSWIWACSSHICWNGGGLYFTHCSIYPSKTLFISATCSLLKTSGTTTYPSLSYYV